MPAHRHFLIALLGLGVFGAAPSSARPQEVHARTTKRPIAGAAGQDPAPPLPEPESLPDPAAPGRPLLPQDPAPLDDDVQLAGAQAPAAPAAEQPFVLTTDGLAAGPQAVSLTVEVKADAVVNLNKEMIVQVVVRNAGNVDARSVVVTDELPEGLEFLDGFTPPPQRAGQRLVWTLSNLPARSEKILKYKAKPTKVVPLDHSATVSLRTAARTRSVVQQPKLKVEMVASTTKVLKGQQVQFKVAVSNPGSGPARNVTVQARITNGLRHEQASKSLDLGIKEIGPSQTIQLSPLVFDTVAGGMQTCDITVISPDVVPDDQATQTARSDVEVTEPQLTLAFSGPDRAYTRKTGQYRLTVENPGTAPAQKVGVAIYIPEGAELAFKPSTGSWDPTTRNLRMSIPRIEAKEKTEYDFRVQFGGEQLVRLAAKAQTPDKSLVANQTYTVNITGIADVRLIAEEKSRILDVGEIAEYEIKLKNVGTKDAAQILIAAEPSKNLEVIETDHDGEEEAKIDKATGRVIFPSIGRLIPGGEQKLILRAKTVAPGRATCRILLTYDGIAEPVETIASARVEALSTPKP